MAEYLVQDTSLAAVADKIRVLSGTTGTMSLDTMKTHVDDVNTEVNTQSNLLAQIVAALEGKANGGGDSGGINIEPFSQMVIGTITPASHMTTFTIPAEITDKIVLFAVGYIGSVSLGATALSTAVWSHFTTSNRGVDGIATSSLIGAGSTGYSGKISISGNTVTFDPSYFLVQGKEYVYIVCTRQNRSTSSHTSGGSN